MEESLGYAWPATAPHPNRALAHVNVVPGGGVRPCSTLPPVLLKLVTETTQMGAMRCQLKTQLDIEVVGALMELVEEDRKPAEQLKGIKSVTAACLVRLPAARSPC